MSTHTYDSHDLLLTIGRIPVNAETFRIMREARRSTRLNGITTRKLTSATKQDISERDQDLALLRKIDARYLLVANTDSQEKRRQIMTRLESLRQRDLIEYHGGLKRWLLTPLGRVELGK